MTTLGWILTGILSAIVILFGYRLVKDFSWNKKLSTFQQDKVGTIVKVPKLYWLKRSYGLVLSSFATLTIVASGVFSMPNIEPITYLTAKSVGSEAALLELIQARNDAYSPVDQEVPGGAPEDNVDFESDDRDFIDTNIQVEGVMEADIVKTDGFTIYYATRYQNKVRVIDVLPNGDLDVREDIDLGNLYTDAIYITETQLIVIGYIYQYFYMMPELDGESRDYYMGGYSSFTGAVYVFDRETLELDYELETDTNFYQHRLINDALYLLSNKYIYTNDLTPSFKETTDGETDEYDLSYDQIYYFEGVPAYNMTVIAALDLTNYSLHTEAFLGSVYQIYASQNAIYTTATVYEYDESDDPNEPVWWGNYEIYTHIVKYEINSAEKTFNYAANGKVRGYIQNQYWMDEYDDYFRIVTTETIWSLEGQQAFNRLYILQANPETQILDQVSLLDEGIGKEGEDVKSVRFNKEKVNVVTFLNTDPLYTIDLTDPENPFILPDPIEEPGYNTYMHVWNEDYYLLGIGYDENFQLKLSAYDTSSNNPNPGAPLTTFNFVEEDAEGIYTYSYSEVLYNPKAIMVDVDKGIFAFPVNTYRYTFNPLKGYDDFAYLSLYYIFYIDFASENVISDPIIVEQDEFMYYSGIDRGVYISFNTNDSDETNDVVMIYTLSFAQIVSYNLTLGEVTATYTFEGMENYNPYGYYVEDQTDDGENPDEEIPPTPEG
ncbi:MAG: hypothetical protein EP317_05305 [Bacillota bacterium]|nr:MAG: hypothetical protein EP317_05305 [Bacillota bacterium]